MKKDLDELIERLNAFNDSVFLADQLMEMADDLRDLDHASVYIYYLKESSIHLSNLFEAAMDLAHYIQTQTDKAKKKPKNPPPIDK